MSEQNVQVTQALEPCLCGRPVNLFRFYERADEEGAHLNLDCSGFASDECPLGLSLTRDVQSEADVEAFIAAWNTRPAPAELVEALEAAVTKLEAERDELLCSFCRTDNGVPDRSTLSADDAPFVDEFETVIEQARTALRNAGAASQVVREAGRGSANG